MDTSRVLHTVGMLGFSLMLTHAPAVYADSSVLARSLAATCANCHGTNGRAVGDGARLAGMPAEKLIKSMAEFRADKRAATIMHQIAKGFTPEQVKLMADYFEAQR